ncbi:MAG: hypothetical protein ACQETH_10720 [Candidatus Rifleibacteriota bacterium]
MSRSYSVSLSVGVTIPEGERLKEGRFDMDFTLLEILSPDRMKSILKEKLLEKGFEETPEGMAMPLNDGQQAVLDLDSMEMQVKVNMPEKCNILVEGLLLEEFQESLARARQEGNVMQNQRVAQQMEIEKNRAVNVLKQIALKAKKEVNLALKETYREAIKEKAASMGNVENVSESKEGNTYRIRVEVSA